MSNTQEYYFFFFFDIGKKLYFYLNSASYIIEFKISMEVGLNMCTCSVLVFFLIQDSIISCLNFNILGLPWNKFVLVLKKRKKDITICQSSDGE